MIACFLCALVGVGGCSSDADDAVPPVTTAAGTTTAVTTIATTSPGTPPTTVPASTQGGAVSPTSAPATSGPDETSPATSPSSTDRPIGFDQADIDAITASFLTFFGGSGSTVDQKLAVLEGSETYRAMLEAASANAQFQEMSTDIREIRSGSDEECGRLRAVSGCAVVVHDVLVGGFPMAVGIESPAVRSDGAWLVGWRAWCNIVEIGGETCPEPTNGAGG